MSLRGFAIVKALIADTLSTWREAERVLDELPPFTADQAVLRAVVVDLRTLYRSLTDANETTAEAVAHGRAMLDRVAATFEGIKAAGQAASPD